jgi:hypothetical protein
MVGLLWLRFYLQEAKGKMKLKPLKLKSPSWQTYFAKEVETLIAGVSTPGSKLSQLPSREYSELDKFLRQDYLPNHLSSTTLETIQQLLALPDNWQSILDAVELIPIGRNSAKDQTTIIGAVAHIEAWRRLQFDDLVEEPRRSPFSGSWPPTG